MVRIFLVFIGPEIYFKTFYVCVRFFFHQINTECKAKMLFQSHFNHTLVALLMACNSLNSIPCPVEHGHIRVVQSGDFNFLVYCSRQTIIETNTSHNVSTVTY